MGLLSHRQLCEQLFARLRYPIAILGVDLSLPSWGAVRSHDILIIQSLSNLKPLGFCNRRGKACKDRLKILEGCVRAGREVRPHGCLWGSCRKVIGWPEQGKRSRTPHWVLGACAPPPQPKHQPPHVGCASFVAQSATVTETTLCSIARVVLLHLH